MRRATFAWFGCVLATLGCGARSGFGEWAASGGSRGTPASSAGSSTLGGVRSGGAGNGAASNGGDANAGGVSQAGSDATTPPPPLLLATAVSVGTGVACALLSDGSVRCWGSNDQGQLGDGTNVAFSSKPVRVLGISNATALATGGTITAGGKGAASSAYGCALLADRSVKCWGRFPGRAFDGSAADSPLPTTITGLSDVTGLAAGNWHACALLASGSVQCWGDNSEGELGTGTVSGCRIWSCPPDSDRAKPVTANLNGVTAISGQGSIGSCVVLPPGVVACWGSFMADVSMPSFLLVGGVVTTAKGLSAGYDHACAVTRSGGVQCWQRGVFPVAVGGFAGPVVAVSAGRFHTCALLDTGVVQCWAEATSSNDTTPRTVANVSDATAISAGYSQTCALIRDGSVRCWSDVRGAQVETISGF
jgi:hypothetical protein